jgi:hypothetical protein
MVHDRLLDAERLAPLKTLVLPNIAALSDRQCAELFGVSFAGRREGPVRNSYLRLEHETAPGHPMLLGLEDAPRIIHGAWQLEVKARVPFPDPPVAFPRCS